MRSGSPAFMNAESSQGTVHLPSAPSYAKSKRRDFSSCGKSFSMDATQRGKDTHGFLSISIFRIGEYAKRESGNDVSRFLLMERLSNAPNSVVSGILTSSVPSILKSLSFGSRHIPGGNSVIGESEISSRDRHQRFPIPSGISRRFVPDIRRVSRRCQFPMSSGSMASGSVFSSYQRFSMASDLRFENPRKYPGSSEKVGLASSTWHTCSGGIPISSLSEANR